MFDKFATVWKPSRGMMIIYEFRNGLYTRNSSKMNFEKKIHPGRAEGFGIDRLPAKNRPGRLVGFGAPALGSSDTRRSRAPTIPKDAKASRPRFGDLTVDDTSASNRHGFRGGNDQIYRLNSDET